MHRVRGTIVVIIALVAVNSAGIASAKPRVEIEVLAQPGLSTASAAQKWTKLFGDLGVGSVRVRGAQADERIGVQVDGKGDTAVVRVTAAMNDRGVLVTSGGQFSLSDRAKLEKWLAGLSTANDPKAKTTVFGITAKQYEEVQTQLAGRVNFSTKGTSPQDVVEKLRRSLKMPLHVDGAIERALAADDPVRDELQGLSIGAALAAIARPVGGVLVARDVNGQTQLALASPNAKGESWPIGWPPKDKDERRYVPKLFEFLDVSLEDVPAGDAIDAVIARLGVPVLYDHNNLVRHKIDMKKPVNVPAGKSYYRKVLEKVLFQAGMKFEVRVDDAERPFLWVTTLKP